MKRLKKWLSSPLVFEDKRDAFVVFFMVLLVGVALGYGWRMKQVEPIIEKEISMLRTHVNSLEGEKRFLVLKIAELESMIIVLKRKK